MSDIGLIKQLTDANTQTLRTLYGEPVDYDDPDAVGANPNAVKYGDGTIVGTTDNGSYVKRPDGTLECRGAYPFSVPIAAGEVHAVNVYFPTLMVDLRYYISASYEPDASIDFYGMVYTIDKTATSCGLVFRNGIVPQNVVGIVFTVTGRWK